MTVSIQLIIACWVIFLGYWFVSARGVKPVAEGPARSSTVIYRVPLVVGGFLLWVRGTSHFLSLALTPCAHFTQAAGVVLCVLGVIVAIWSRRILAGNWSSEVTFKEGHELIQTGPYRFARHPIYSGILLICLGTVVAQGQLHRWIGFVLMFAGFWIKLRQEESLMERHFPNAYSSYRNRVKALVPFII
jgi:protein-S-isoprenylcysteine O-methyltransferase Ste14